MRHTNELLADIQELTLELYNDELTPKDDELLQLCIDILKQMRASDVLKQMRADNEPIDPIIDYVRKLEWGEDGVGPYSWRKEEDKG